MIANDTILPTNDEEVNFDLPNISVKISDLFFPEMSSLTNLLI